MTGSEARALAQHLVQRSDDALTALFAARHVSPTASWSDAFDAAEALLDPSSIERTLRGRAAVDPDDDRGMAHLEGDALRLGRQVFLRLGLF